MEKLVVRNFGPIKDVEIEMSKYTILIGDTSTGKSILAKLIIIFRDPKFIVSSNKKEKFLDLLKFYNMDFDYSNSEIIYYNNGIELKLVSSKFIAKGENKVWKEQNFNNDYDFENNPLDDTIEKLNKILNNEEGLIDEEELTKIKTNFIKLKHQMDLSPIELSVYIPAERILNSLIGDSISGLWANNVALPQCYKEFAAKYEVARKKIKSINFKSFDFTYKFDKGEDKIKFKTNFLRLSETSSGIQSLLPLLLVLYYETDTERLDFSKSLVIEEPESNLFPSKQKLLVEEITQRINQSNNKLIITTHSPYILSSFDNLILAYNTFIEKPKLKSKLEKVIPSDKWINYDRISVYQILNNGTAKSIKNDEFKSIDSNAIDSVSDIISEKFDKLTELRYG